MGIARGSASGQRNEITNSHKEGTMALTRHEDEDLWPRLERGFLDWPARTSQMWRRFLDDDQFKVEEFTKDNELVVRAELPGIDPERDVDISIIDGNLSIRAERRHEEKVEERNYRRSEFRYGSFSRVLPLPPKAKETDIKASYKDGILEVHAPIDTAPSKASKIRVDRN
jgi:HSP20 family protein